MCNIYQVLVSSYNMRMEFLATAVDGNHEIENVKHHKMKGF